MTLNGNSQSLADTLLFLKPFTLIENRSPEQNPGLNKIHISSKESFNKPYSLAELLGRNSPAFVKQYSPGNLASPSLRGTGSAHTALVWNGVNLQSSMNGQLDLSLLPAILFDEFLIQEGAGAASWGSGAIGGTVFVNSNSGNSTGLRLIQNSGSYGFRQQAADLSVAEKRIQLRTRVFRGENLNNFKFVNIAHPDKPLEHQRNAAQNAWGFMQDLNLTLSKKIRFNASFWKQKSHRHIPPILTVPHSVAYQEDESLRATGQWIYEGKKSSFKARIAYLKESIAFNDSFLNVESNNNSKSYIVEFVWLRKINEKHNFEFGHIYTLNRANAKGYGDQEKEQNRPAFFTSLKSNWFKNKKTESLFTLRQEFFDAKAINPLPSFSISHLLNDFVSLRGQVAATFRVPTLNDLYWLPGGNPDLLPETGYSYEAGLKLNLIRSNNWNSDLNLGYFSNQVENWILWVPTGSYWSPQNVNTVHSRGAEMNLNVAGKINRTLGIEFTSHWQMVKSTVIKNEQYPLTVGKQLIYVPDFTSNSNLSVNFNNWRLNFIHSYSGIRYVTTDNSEGLPAFNIFNCSLSKDFQVSNQHASAFFQLNNIGNTTYQVVVRRPMPLRTWMAGISFEFKT